MLPLLYLLLYFSTYLLAENETNLLYMFSPSIMLTRSNETKCTNCAFGLPVESESSSREQGEVRETLRGAFLLLLSAARRFSKRLGNVAAAVASLGSDLRWTPENSPLFM